MLDLESRESILNSMDTAKPDIVVHCAALTDVDRCERDRELTRRVNVEGTRLLADASRRMDAHFVFVSTDYVFDGEKGSYTEEDKPHPINFYGFSKWLGERAVAELCSEHLIARSSVIYGAQPSTGKTNFALWLLQNLRQGTEVSVLCDQFVSPTLNVNLAQMLLEACERRLTGVVHLAGATRTSRYEFAVRLAEVFNLDKDLIREAEMGEMRWAARRPKDSSLVVSKAHATLEAKPMNLNEALTLLRKEIRLAPWDSG